MGEGGERNQRMSMRITMKGFNVLDGGVIKGMSRRR